MQDLIIDQTNKKLAFYHSPTIYESRGKSVEIIIKDTINQYNINQNFHFIVNTDDAPIYNNCSTYFFSTTNNEYDRCFPCFLYDSWPEVGIKSYTDLIRSLVDTKPDTNKIGWIGSPMSYPRQIFCQIYQNTDFSEAIINDWNRIDPQNLAQNTITYLTYQQQIDKWKYLIDFEGAGYSARTKILLNSPRIVFIVDRPYKEFWYEHLIPWKHYIPVKRDLSDLETNYSIIESDIKLQSYIKKSQKIFSTNWLSYNKAIEQAYKIINKNIKK